MRLPKINYANPYRMKRNMIIARKIPQRAVKVLASELTFSKEIALKKLLPGVMIVAEALTQSPHTAEIAARINSASINKSGLILRNGLKRYKLNGSPEPLPFSSANIKPRNKFTRNSPSLTAKYDGSPEELDYLISKLLEKKKGDKTKNPLFGKGKSFIDSAERYGVNPSVLVAISMLESGRGTSYAARKRNNIGGLVGKNGTLKFQNVDDCIEAMAKIIQKHTKNNIQTIEELGLSGKYCDKSVGDKWADNVVYYINKL